MGEQVKTTYSVNGSSSTRPEGLPEGLQVVEDSKTFPTLTVVSNGGRTCTFEEKPGIVRNTGWVRVDFEGTMRSFKIEDARKIGEWLIEVADSYKQELREYTTSSGVWYEIEPEWFVTARSRAAAVRISEGEYRSGFGYDSFESLKLSYPNGTLSGETKLRKFSDGTSTRSHWYEVKPEWVVWA